ncbi:hypothetical protein ABI59_10480 [Acidobacteria bacterium Mor1]|nr:hypothetical protein ABI59_10480 [Acidobacteria bacterium Mor1]
MGKRLENARNLYFDAIRDGKPAEAIKKYSGARYTQHSTPVRDGREGFIAFFDEFLARNPVREIEILRGFEDGQYVFLHVLQTLNNGEFRYVTADIFDTDADGKMIEHWDIIAEMTDDTLSGHSQIDGPTEPEDLDRTEANKTLVRRFLSEVLATGDYARAAEFISSERYIQHNPGIADGIAGFRAFVDSLDADGKSMRYEEVHKVVGCGSLVATLSKVDRGGTGLAVMDLFRVDAGKIVEHWDVIEEITPEETWVNSGKF